MLTVASSSEAQRDSPLAAVPTAERPAAAEASAGLRLDQNPEACRPPPLKKRPLNDDLLMWTGGASGRPTDGIDIVNDNVTPTRGAMAGGGGAVHGVNTRADTGGHSNASGNMGGTEQDPYPHTEVGAVKQSAYADEHSSRGSASSLSSSGSAAEQDQGPLITSVGSDGEPQDSVSTNETEEALIAQQTDMIAPKAAVPDLRGPPREGSDPGTLAPANDAGFVAGSTSAAPDNNRQRSAEHSRASTQPPGALAPMEPMEPNSGISERKKLPPLSAGFPTVPGFPAGDPGSTTVIPSHEGRGKSGHNLPSLVESARNLTSDVRARLGNQFGPVNSNIMADMYTAPGNRAPYLHGITSQRERPGNTSTASQLSTMSYDDTNSVAASTAPSTTYAPSNSRNRDPRFSYTYPHGVLTGPAGVVPDVSDGISTLQSQYSYVPQPHVMTVAPSVPYQASHPVHVVPHNGGAPPQQQSFTPTAIPVMFGPQQTYPQLSMPGQYSGTAPDSAASASHQQPQQLRSRAPPEPRAAASSRAGHGGVSNSAGRQHSLPPAVSESRTYRCTYPGCDWSFVRSSDQKRHIRSHEKPSLQCPYWEIHSNCNRKGGLFYRLDVLKRHLRLVHLVRPTDGTDDGGSCRVCSKVFEHTRDFISHCQACADAAKERMLSEREHASNL